jgi:hypothetical protein
MNSPVMESGMPGLRTYSFLMVDFVPFLVPGIFAV